MAINFTQTDSTTGSCGSDAAYCSGLTPTANSVAARRCADGESAGSTEFNVNPTGSASDLGFACWTCIIDASVSWDSGTWTVRFNVTTENMFVTWDSVHICRVNSSCTNQESLGSSSSLGISCGSAGVKSTTVSGSAVASPSAGDKIVIVLGFSNSSMNTQIIGITPDQNIDSPFTVATAIDYPRGLFGQTRNMRPRRTMRELLMPKRPPLWVPSRALLAA